MTFHLLVTGGGTGGHTYPAVTTVHAVAELRRPFRVTWVGSHAGLEAKVAAENGIPFRSVATGKVRRSPSPRELLRNLADLSRVPYGVAQAIWIVARARPDVVLSTGGYVCVPVGLAAWLTRRPLVVHEQTTSVGLANRLLARFATQVALSHDSSAAGLPARARSKAVVTGNPIRAGLLAGDRRAGLGHFGLRPDLPLVYVTGGALGSLQINTLVEQILPSLLPAAQVVHQCGPGQVARLQERAGLLEPRLAERYRPVPFVGPELPDLLAAADVVVARSGAGTLSELSAAGKPAIYIPLASSAGDEQLRGALRSVEAGAASCLTGADATPAQLRHELHALLADPVRRDRMAVAARSLGRPHAATELAQVVLDAAG
jgi:UDP-N-acetylglucosamine--N-acetylmuramyl-(pentapeptide) pyrophosphoryl-undecaprenol N-acetylglucosamine transferase